jgi:hypothetical protein
MKALLPALPAQQPKRKRRLLLRPPALPQNLRVLLPVVVDTTLVGVRRQGTQLRTARRRLLLATKVHRRRVEYLFPLLFDTYLMLLFVGRWRGSWKRKGKGPW